MLRHTMCHVVHTWISELVHGVQLRFNNDYNIPYGSTYNTSEGKKYKCISKY
jgi:hypothetical protein